MIYKRGTGKQKLFWMDITVNGVRYREPLKTSNWRDAVRKERARITEIDQGKAGVRGPAARQTFNAAVDLYIEERQLHSAEKSCRTDRERSQALRRAFGEWPLKRITAGSILAYQTKRRKTISSRSSRGSGTISGRTINMEVGLLARVLKKNKAWSRIADDVHMLPEDPKEARILQPDEKSRLLEVARSRDEWQITYCAAVIALNTTCRSCELRGLRWKFVDWQAMTVSIIRKTTKTRGGVRVLPLNADALVALMELRSRAELLGSHDPEHFVFPTCEHGHFDPTRAMKGWRTSWRNLTERAGLKGLRFHDLRHQAITELAESGLSDQTVMSIAGHVSPRMLNHYSHIRLEAKRQALRGLENQTGSADLPRREEAGLTPVTSQSTSQTAKPTESGSVSDSF